MKALLLGDLSPSAYNSHLFEEKRIDILFEDTLSLFEGKDIKFVNLEVAITDSDNPIEKFGPPLKCPPATADVMKAVGINICGLSNNHIFDFGRRGIADTKAALEGVGITYTGFGDNYEASRKNLIIDNGSEKVCIIAVCEHEYSYALENRMGSRPYDEYDTMSDIRRAKAENDRVIVIYHGGKEHCRYPSPRLFRACRAMAENGADVVLCQHSHCIGCYEEYRGCHILYGQGNFHFESDCEEGEGWGSCLAVDYDTESGNIEFTPIVSNGKGGIRLADNKEKQDILCSFAERNKALENGEWKRGWQEFCESVKERYVKAVREAFCEDSTERQNHKFAHYLDCEAHLDVWRELFKTANHTNELDD
jgi:poly-gamma-glutamate synthesis protein (capsule biosynthesis protein)